MSVKPKILVIRGGAIGDFILTLPVLSALKRQFPQAHLEVLGYPHIVSLAVNGGLADAVRSIDAGPLAGFFARNGNLDAKLQEYFSQFALIISYLFDPDKIFQTNISRCSKAQFIFGPHRPKEKDGVHATKVFLQPLERLAIFDADPVPRLPKPAVETVNLPGGPWLAMHPGSGSQSKNWAEDRWLKLLRQLVETSDRNILLVGGEAEGERLERLTRELPVSRIETARSLPLTELARRLVRCNGFVGHDSGISHLAASLGLPMLLLWGATAENVWRPQGARITLIRDSGGLDALTTDAVFGAMRSFLSAI